MIAFLLVFALRRETRCLTEILLMEPLCLRPGC